MMGVTVDDQLVVSPNLNCVLALPVIEDEKTTECLRCGKCINVCPAKICPVLIKDAIKDKERLKELNPKKCIECGLCTYVCPAKINVREIIRDAKRKISE